MRLSILVTSDLHLTANPKDEYRWKLFPWLATQCRSKRVRALLILGDLTDAKDYHSAELVNRIVYNLDRVSDEVDQIIILTGNHDYLKEGHAFFKFLNYHPKIKVITEPTEDAPRAGRDEIVSAVFLPHSKDIKKDWRGFPPYNYDYTFMHQTVQGSVAGNGRVMESGISNRFKIKMNQRIYSGDIHVPQVVGDVIYVGSPYPIHFGDSFKPRCVFIDKDRLARDLYFPTLQRLMIDLRSGALHDWPHTYEGDQIKLRIHLNSADRLIWDQIKRDILEEAKSRNVEVVSLELKSVIERRSLTGKPARNKTLAPEDTIQDYLTSQDLGGDLLEAGLVCLGD